jgi:hypothetical protein
MDEAATMTKEFFGDFTPLKQTKFDRHAQDFVLFYKFRKWNTVQQMRVMARDPKWSSYIAKLMRTLEHDLSDDERAVTKVYREKYGDPFIMARRDETGQTWDRNGKQLRSQYALANPFGSWYSPSETMLWMNPAREAAETVILAQEIQPDRMGVLGSFWAGVDSFNESLHIEDPELSAKARMRAGAHFTNTNRITRYFKGYFQEREGWQDDMTDRLFRTQYTKYLSLQDAVVTARKRIGENDQRVQANAIMYARINKLYNQISTLRQRKPHEFTPYDWD